MHNRNEQFFEKLLQLEDRLDRIQEDMVQLTRLCTEVHYINLIKKSFTDLRINLPIDGSLDGLIHIKDSPNTEIGDYNLRDPEIERYQSRILRTADDADRFEIAKEPCHVTTRE